MDSNSHSCGNNDKGDARDNNDYDYYLVVRPLLQSLGFQGDDRVIFEAMPHLIAHLGLEELREFMVNLGYASKRRKVSLKNLPGHPGILKTKKGLFLMTYADGESIELVNLLTKEQQSVPRRHRLRGEFCYFFTNSRPLSAKDKWLDDVIERFKPQAFHLFLIGLLNAIFALTLPLFIRSVFDWAIPTRSEETLNYLLVGLVIALLCHHVIHGFQNKSLAFVGARLNMIISLSVVQKLLRLPYSYVETAPVQEQVSRIKQFDGLKDFFTSPLAQLILEGPFVIFFIIVLGILAGSLVIIPIILLVLFIILAMIFFPMIRASTRLSSFTYNDKLAFMLESFSKINTLKYLGGERIFSRRFEEKTYNNSKALEQSEVINSYASNLSQILIKIAGVVTILWGSTRVMTGDMTVGSLVAVVLLIWRALSPFQAAFMFLSQFDLTLSTIKQLNQLMALPIESYAPTHVNRQKLKGYVSCDHVSFRYPGSASLALHDVMLEARPGEIVAIMGENASGKSTLLKLLLGFYQPMSGSIYLDSFDIKQMPVNHLRQSVGFVPQHIQFFHGTVEQNLLLSAPDTSRAQMIEACKKALVWEDICMLGNGLDTKLSDRSTSHLNAGFQQKLSLARAYLRDSSVLLFDEPGSNLDLQGDKWFKETLLTWHGVKTMVVVTHRPSVVSLSDRLLVLSSGKMRYFGPTNKVLELMKEEGAA